MVIRRTMNRTSRDVSPAIQKRFKQLRNYGFSVSDATRIARQDALIVGHVGDVNWIDHGGGPVYKNPNYPGQYRLEYIQPAQSDYPYWEVYRIDFPDKEAAKDYLRDGNIQKYTGVSTREFLSALRNKNPLAEASVWESIGQTIGFHELDSDPLRLNAKQIYLRYGEEPSEIY